MSLWVLNLNQQTSAVKQKGCCSCAPLPFSLLTSTPHLLHFHYHQQEHTRAWSDNTKKNNIQAQYLFVHSRWLMKGPPFSIIPGLIILTGLLHVKLWVKSGKPSGCDNFQLSYLESGLLQWVWMLNAFIFNANKPLALLIPGCSRTWCCSQCDVHSTSVHICASVRSQLLF